MTKGRKKSPQVTTVSGRTKTVPGTQRVWSGVRFADADDADGTLLGVFS